MLYLMPFPYTQLVIVTHCDNTPGGVGHVCYGAIMSLFVEEENTV